MSSLQLFNYEHHEVRTILIDGEPWFVLADVCRILGIANPSDAASRLDDDDLGSTEVIDSLNRKQTARIVNESGLYDVAFMSRKPEARDFKRWVTRTVLPEIRKTGSYSIQPTAPALPASYADALRELAANVEAKAIADARIIELEPKADYADMITESDGLRTVTDLLNDLKLYAASNHPGAKVVQNDVFDLAGELGVIIRGNTVRNNMPTARGIEAKWVRPHEVTYERKSGEKVTKRYSRLTPRGYARIWEEAVTRLKNNQPIFTPKEKAA